MLIAAINLDPGVTETTVGTSVVVLKRIWQAVAIIHPTTALPPITTPTTPTMEQLEYTVTHC